MYVRSLASVQRSDYESAGIIASDLALLREQKFSIPLGIVVTSDSFSAFLSKNGLKNRLIQMYHGVTASQTQKINDLYEQVKKLFLSSEMPPDFVPELVETYHSLGVSGKGAQSIIGGSNNPPVLVYKSPGYVMEEDDFTGIFMNVRGEDMLVKAVLASWASLFSPKSVTYRLEHNIRFPETCSLIIQEFIPEGRCCKINVADREITVDSYFGLPDLHNELVKDHHVLDREFLHILDYKISYQEYKIGVSEGSLVRKRLQQLGNEQKFNDKEIMECGRIGKRASQFVQKNLSLTINLREGFNILWVTRRTNTEVTKPIYETPLESELDTINKVSQEIKLFEEKNVETSESEFTFNEIDLDAPSTNDVDQDMEINVDDEFVDKDFTPVKPVVQEYEQNYDEEIFPEDETEPYTDEVTVEEYSDKNSFEDNFVRQEPSNNIDTFEVEEYSSNNLVDDAEEKVVAKDEEFMMPQVIETYEETSEDNDFIMPVEEFIEVAAEPKKEFKPNDIFKSVEYDATSIIVKVDHLIYDTLKKKHTQIYNKDVSNIYQIIEELKQKMYVPLQEEVKKVRMLRDEFLEKGRLLSTEEIKYVLDVGKKFFNELK